MTKGVTTGLDLFSVLRRMLDLVCLRECETTGHPTCLDGDQARGTGVKLRPMVGKPREVFLGDDVVIARRRRVETIEDDSDEQVHEDVRDRQREAFIRVARGGLAEATGQGVYDRRCCC